MSLDYTSYSCSVSADNFSDYEYEYENRPACAGLSAIRFIRGLNTEH